MKKVLLVLGLMFVGMGSYAQTYKVKGLKNYTVEFKQDTIITTTKQSGRVVSVLPMTRNGDIRYYTASGNNYEFRYTVTKDAFIIDIKDKFTGEVTSTVMYIKEIK